MESVLSVFNPHAEQISPVLFLTYFIPGVPHSRHLLLMVWTRSRVAACMTFILVGFRCARMSVSMNTRLFNGNLSIFSTVSFNLISLVIPFSIYLVSLLFFLTTSPCSGNPTCLANISASSTLLTLASCYISLQRFIASNKLPIIFQIN